MIYNKFVYLNSNIFLIYNYNMELSRDEFIEKYGHIMVKFYAYCNYCFSFITINDEYDIDNDELRISIQIEGQDNIKLLEFSSDDIFTIKYLHPTSGKVYKGYKQIHFFKNNIY